MSNVMHPAGPEGARVYWIRRLIVIAVAIGLIALLWAFFARDGKSSSSGQRTVAPTSSPTTSAPAGVGNCAAASLQLTLTASAQAYAAGQTPSFTLTATNTSKVACTLTMSDASRQVVITSGSDRVWSSADCPATAPPASPLLLVGAGEKSSATLTWDRSRSAQGCASGLATPRSGTYKAAASLLGANSDAVIFALS
jgi:hypothetical protein